MCVCACACVCTKHSCLQLVSVIVYVDSIDTHLSLRFVVNSYPVASVHSVPDVCIVHVYSVDILLRSRFVVNTYPAATVQ